MAVGPFTKQAEPKSFYTPPPRQPPEIQGPPGNSMSLFQKIVDPSYQAGPGRSESVPFIHEKWRRSPLFRPGIRDLERGRRERDEGVNLRLRRLRLGLRILQTFFTYQFCHGGSDFRLVIVALLSQSLVVFVTTRDGLIDPTTLIWPRTMEIWPSALVLSMSAIIMLFSFGRIQKYNANYSPGGGLLLRFQDHQQLVVCLPYIHCHFHHDQCFHIHNKYDYLENSAAFRAAFMASVVLLCHHNEPIRPHNNLSITRSFPCLIVANSRTGLSTASSSV